MFSAVLLWNGERGVKGGDGGGVSLCNEKAFHGNQGDSLTSFPTQCV